jgi:hypothetical protein
MRIPQVLYDPGTSQGMTFRYHQISSTHALGVPAISYELGLFDYRIAAAKNLNLLVSLKVPVANIDY